LREEAEEEEEVVILGVVASEAAILGVVASEAAILGVVVGAILGVVVVEEGTPTWARMALFLVSSELVVVTMHRFWL